MTVPGPPQYRGIPLLAELEEDLRVQLAALPDVTSAPVAPPATAPRQPRSDHHRRRTHPQRTGGRVARRVSVLVGVLLLVGASAVAERSLDGDSRDGPSTRPAMLASSDRGWQLNAYRNEGDVCHAFVIDQTVSSACGAPPGRKGLRVSSVNGRHARYVVGLTGPDAVAVLISAGDRRERVPTQVAEAGIGKRAGLPAGLRWFVATIALTARTHDAPARVVPLDAAGRPLAKKGYLDCSLGQGSAACRTLTRRRAEG